MCEHNVCMLTCLFTYHSRDEESMTEQKALDARMFQKLGTKRRAEVVPVYI